MAMGRECLCGGGEIIARAAAEGESASSAGTWSETDTESEATSRSKSSGRHQMLRPVLATMPTQGYSLEELVHLAVARLVNQRPRQAVVKIPGRHSMAMRVPDVPPGVTAAARVERACHEALLETPYVTAAEQVQEELAERRRWLLDQARAPVLPQPKAMIMVPGRPEEPMSVAAAGAQQEPEDWFE